MRINKTTNRYSLKVGRRNLLIEELKNERGEKIFSILQTIYATTLDDKEWLADTSNVKPLDRKNLDPELKKFLKVIGI